MITIHHVDDIHCQSKIQLLILHPCRFLYHFEENTNDLGSDRSTRDHLLTPEVVPILSSSQDLGISFNAEEEEERYIRAHRRMVLQEKKQARYKLEEIESLKCDLEKRIVKLSQMEEGAFMNLNESFFPFEMGRKEQMIMAARQLSVNYGRII